MAVRIITVPFDTERGVFHDDELTRFLLDKQVLDLHPQFFQAGNRAYWTVFVEYETVLSQPRKARADDDLNEPQRLLLKRLREWRKERAEREGVPVFLLATNSQLFEIIRLRPLTMEALRQVRGFGKKKIERYGTDILTIIRAFCYKERSSGRPTGEEDVHKTENGDASMGDGDR